MIWKTNANFPDYEISSDGQVRRAIDSNAWAKAGTILPGRILKSGYRQFKLIDRNGHKRGIRANRLVAETFIGPPPSATHQAAHNDGNRLNNAHGNLRWATPKENDADKVLHGTRQKGERIGTARLDEAKVIEIRSTWTGARGELISFARRYGVGTTTIRRVVFGATWAHVPGRSALDKRQLRVVASR